MALQSGPSRHKKYKENFFVLQTKCMRLLTFSDFLENTSPSLNYFVNLVGLHKIKTY